MRALFQLLGAVTAVAAAGLGVAVLAKKLGKEFPIKVTVDVAEDAEQDKETADKTAAAYNEYILKNTYVFRDSIPEDIASSLAYLD